jgi:hypothetical protein
LDLGGMKWQEGGGNCITRSFITWTLSQVKEDEMGGEFSKHRDEEEYV